MAYQDKFWKGQSKRTNNHDKLRGNPEAKPMHEGPGEFDEDMGTGADAPKLGSSQPRAKGNKRGDELPLKHAHTQPKRRQMHQVLMAQALRRHGMAEDGTTMGTAVGGGAAGGGAGGA